MHNVGPYQYFNKNARSGRRSCTNPTPSNVGLLHFMNFTYARSRVFVTVNVGEYVLQGAGGIVAASRRTINKHAEIN